jgi:hypothetical protein
MLERWLLAAWDSCAIFWNSNFGAAVISALIGSLAGAWGGAHAIQRIAERATRREALRKEVLKTNAAIGQTYSLVTTFLNLKEQFFVPISRRFSEIEEIVHEIEAAGCRGRTCPRSSLRSFCMGSYGRG